MCVPLSIKIRYLRPKSMLPLMCLQDCWLARDSVTTRITLLLLQHEIQKEQEGGSTEPSLSWATKTTGPIGYKDHMKTVNSEHHSTDMVFFQGTKKKENTRLASPSSSSGAEILLSYRVSLHQLVVDDHQCQVHSVQNVCSKTKNSTRTCIWGGTGRLFISTGRPARETSISLLKERACLWNSNE